MVSLARQLIVLMMENTSAAQFLAHWPHSVAIAKQYTFLSHGFGVFHPSLPNYLGVLAGSTEGVSSDGTPAQVGGPFQLPTLIGQLDQAHTWRIYAEGIPHTGYIGPDSGSYVQHHVPEVYFSTFISDPTYLARLVGFQTLLSDLQGPFQDFTRITPIDAHNGHTSASSGDAWLAAPGTGFLEHVIASPFYGRGGTVLIEFDEGPKGDHHGIGDANPGGGSAAAFIVSQTAKGKGVNATPFNSYGVCRTVGTHFQLLRYLAHAGNPANGDLSAFL